MIEYCATKWKIDVEGMPKLRRYVEIKDCYRQEPIVCKNMSSKQRAVISKLRSGTLPIAIETGRFRTTPLQERLCGLCNNHSIEDETHFLLHCNAYLLERQRMLAKIDEKLDISIFELNSDELFKVLISNPEIICDVANFLLVTLEKRSRNS